MADDQCGSTRLALLGSATARWAAPPPPHLKYWTWVALKRLWLTERKHIEGRVGGVVGGQHLAPRISKRMPAHELSLFSCQAHLKQ